MTRICCNYPLLLQFSRETDHLGWRNFMEAKVSTQLFEMQAAWLIGQGSTTSIESWSRSFLMKLIDITHQQWLYRNARLHIRHVEGLSLAEHGHILEKVYSMIDTDPMALLPEHRSLLQVDYEGLGKGSSMDRQYWIVNMESALKAKRRIQDEHIIANGSKRRRIT